MGLINAILTGFTGIQSNQFAVATIGNNVANVKYMFTRFATRLRNSMDKVHGK